MTQDAFWLLVGKVRQRVEKDYPQFQVLQKCDKYADCLSQELQGLGALELELFQDHLQVAVGEAYIPGANQPQQIVKLRGDGQVY